MLYIPAKMQWKWEKLAWLENQRDLTSWLSSGRVHAGNHLEAGRENEWKLQIHTLSPSLLIFSNQSYVWMPHSVVQTSFHNFFMYFFPLNVPNIVSPAHPPLSLEAAVNRLASPLKDASGPGFLTLEPKSYFSHLWFLRAFSWVTVT